jgi:hypothetical protein
MDYPGDCPPSPEERARLRLAANAAWLARIKEGRDAQHIAWAEKRMEQDNQTVLAAAQTTIEAERKAHRCYICGRSDLPRWSRWFGLWAAGLIGMWLYISETGRDTVVGYFGLVALGAALAGGMYEGIKPADEEEARRRFHGTPHS